MSTIWYVYSWQKAAAGIGIFSTSTILKHCFPLYLIFRWRHTLLDVLRAQDDPNKFFFYEVYKSSSDVDFHKTQAHYQAWTQFKESGGTVTSVSKKALGEFMAPTTDTE